MNRAIAILLLLTLACVTSVSMPSSVSIEAQGRGKREVDKMKDFRAIIFKQGATMAERVKAVEALPRIESAGTARGLGEIYTEIVEKEGASDVTNALREKMRGIKHEATLVSLRDDVKDVGKTDEDLRGDWFRANLSLQDEAADDFIVSVADDKVPTMRMYAVEAIGARRIAKGYERVLGALADNGSWRVRSAAISAVVSFVKYDKPKYLNVSVDALMDSLNREKGGMQQDVMFALKEVSGKDFGFDPQAWWAWYQEFRKGGDKKGETNSRPGSRPYGVPTYSRQVVYIIDTSKSMEEEIEKEEIDKIRQPITGKDRDKPEEEKDPDTDWDTVKTRLDLARAELIRTIRRLQDDSWFTVICYSTKVTVWKPELVQASKAVKDEAIAMLKGLKTTQLTNIYGALDEAFKVAEAAIKASEEAAAKAKEGKPSKTGKNKSGTREEEPEFRVPDTIYFLSDGFATTGEFKGPDIQGAATPEQAAKYHEAMTKMLERIKERNEKARMRINVIGVGKDHDNITLPKLAAQNRGTYVAIGDPRAKK